MSTIRTSRGFTLIELLVAIVILCVLAAVVLFAISGGDATGYQDEGRCDGPNMIYENWEGDVQAVAANDPRCTSTRTPG